jgi:hypothetical protein
MNREINQMDIPLMHGSFLLFFLLQTQIPGITITLIQICDHLGPQKFKLKIIITAVRIITSVTESV